MLTEEMISIIFLLIGLGFFIIHMYCFNKTLKESIIRNSIFIIVALVYIIIYQVDYISFTIETLIYGFGIGLLFFLIHLCINHGIKLRKKDVNRGLIKTSLIIYGIELPAEEFLYRGLIMLPLVVLFGPFIAIVLSTLVFLVLHLKTHKNTFIRFGSFVIGVACSITIIITSSIWTGLIIHILNNFAFMTLVNKTNIFKTRQTS